MVIEAGVIAGYVIAWAVRKARRVGGRLDAEADAVIDAGLDQLHEVVAAKLAGHPVLAELVEEAAAGGGEVSDLTRQQVELALTAAARKDEAFGHMVTELVARLREAEQAIGRPVIAGAGSAVFTGDAACPGRGRGDRVRPGRWGRALGPGGGGPSRAGAARPLTAPGTLRRLAGAGPMWPRSDTGALSEVSHQQDGAQDPGRPAADPHPGSRRREWRSVWRGRSRSTRAPPRGQLGRRTCSRCGGSRRRILRA